jgi:NitT/TauT family transport system substrate-binding protein
LYKAFWTALEEATALINRDRRSAAEIYKTATNDKGPVENILKILEHPEMQYRLAPENVLKFADFMHKIGSIKVKPENWRELFFPETHSLPGS